MIRVTKQPEPSCFQTEVAQKGEKWLAEQKWFDASRRGQCQTVPEKTKFPTHWTAVGHELYDAYHGICAYLGIFFEYSTGASSVDHFLPKTKYPGLAYRWENYRLSCLGENRRKGQKTDILDPFEVDNDWFDVNLATGQILPNQALSQALQAKINETIEELGLDDIDCRDMRKKRIARFFKKDITEDYFREQSPFLWQVLRNQGYV